MPSAPPDGDPAPPDGSLPPEALATLASAPFGVYVHVPFCSVRCGYCDFNTYTLTELGDGSVPGAGAETFAQAAQAELDLAARVLGPSTPEVATVFVGGGTPSMLDPHDLVAILDRIRDLWSLTGGAEVTTEANPDSVTPEGLQVLADGGFTRVSLGMQSAVSHVLATLDRTHDPRNVAVAVAGARAAGLQVSLDLIYGTPGESPADWQASLDAAPALEPDHVSAYALVVEEGTRMGAAVRRGELPRPDDDDEADLYELADARLAAAGYEWYEISNWARDPAARCRHNLGYWQGGNWWGVGPGAHSHVGGVRWWNVRHPRTWAQRLAAGRSPAQAREVLSAEQRHEERVLLGVRLADGLPLADLDEAGRRAVAGLVADGLVEPAAALRERKVVLTGRGRLLADTVVRALLGWG